MPCLCSFLEDEEVTWPQSPSVRRGEIIGLVGTRLCHMPLEAPGCGSSGPSGDSVPVIPAAKAPGPADASGGSEGLMGGMGGSTCRPLGLLPKRAAKWWQLQGRVCRQPQSQARWGPLEGGGWQQLCAQALLQSLNHTLDRRRLARGNARRK